MSQVGTNPDDIELNVIYKGKDCMQDTIRKNRQVRTKMDTDTLEKRRTI